MRTTDILTIDIETYSSVDLIKCGVYKYAESDDFQVLLFAYAFNDQEVQIIDLTTHPLPQKLRDALVNPKIIKTAFNANFERTCLARYLDEPMPAHQWRCTAVLSLMCGYNGHLDGTAKALGIDAQKDARGKKLINLFSKPNKDGKRITRKEAIEDWEAFKDYCVQDVVVEREIRRVLSAMLPDTDREQALWVLDQEINDRGIKVDHVLVSHALALDDQLQQSLIAEAEKITGISNPKSVAQLKEWLRTEEDIEVTSMRKEAVATLIDEVSGSAAQRVLEIRQLLGKTSIGKYKAMERSMCLDNRVRGMLQFYGANRSGRWAGRIVQLQNLPRNSLSDLNLARQLLISGNYSVLEMLYASVPDVLSQLIRTAFIPRDGHKFVVADFSAIEARVIAWLAGEQWRLDVFATHGKIYEASAAQMFNVPIKSIGKGSELRQKGKIAELALGYQGGVNALVAMGADKMGLNDAEMKEIVSRWRSANPAIVKLWADMEQAAIYAVKYQKTQTIQKGITFIADANHLWIKLPSGRKLGYVKPRLEINRFGREAIVYDGTNQMTKAWGAVGTYGGKLVENVVQAIARDCLAETMFKLDDWNYQIVAHVHDEVIVEVPKLFEAEEILEIMSEPIKWAPGLKLNADGFECEYYRKD